MIAKLLEGAKILVPILLKSPFKFKISIFSGIRIYVSKKNKYSNHNLNYWMYGDYLGVGPGAHSKITMNESIKRMIKLKAVQSYIDAPSKTKDFFINSESYDLDLAMNLLRIKQGISFKEIEEKGIYIPDTFMEKRRKERNKAKREMRTGHDGRPLLFPTTDVSGRDCRRWIYKGGCCFSRACAIIHYHSVFTQHKPIPYFANIKL